MTKLIILRGVPGSGKSTEAQRLRKEYHATIVNRDSIRFSLYGVYWGKGVNENVVTDVENTAIESALRAGEDVILDATNLRAKNLKTKLSIAARWGATVEYHDFVVDYATAVSRDYNRERTVGDKVIKGFFEKYKIDRNTGILPPPPEPLPYFAPYFRDTTKPLAYIVDTDGTVADHEGVRGIYDTSKYHLDKVREHVAVLVSEAANSAYIIGLSGRDDTYRDVTEAWWVDNGIPFSRFYMRPAGDKRLDAIIKYELFKEHIEPNYNVLAALDDRPQVIRMWKTIGVDVIDVGNGVEF